MPITLNTCSCLDSSRGIKVGGDLHMTSIILIAHQLEMETQGEGHKQMTSTHMTGFSDMIIEMRTHTTHITEILIHTGGQ